MGSTMKAVEIRGGKGPASTLFINPSTPKPTAGAGQIVVRVHAFGLNRMDLIQREGHYPLPPQAPSTLGVEFSGVVDHVGENTKQFAPGDEVLGLAYGGAYAEYVAVDEKTVLHKPAGLSWEQAAGVPETFMTATQALHEIGGFAAGRSVLWHAGASGVGIAGIQLSVDAGASAVYATAGTDEKCRFLEREFGVAKAFNYKDTTDGGWAKRLQDATGGKGVDLIVDFVGATHFPGNIAVAAVDARWVMLGLMGGSRLEGVDIGAILFKRIRIEGSTLRSRSPEYQGRLRDKLADYMPHFESGKLKVQIDSVFPMEDIIKAHELLEKNTTMGKIICTVS